jgi:hypothetical protein
LFETLNNNFPRTTGVKVIQNDSIQKNITVNVTFAKTNLQKFEKRPHSNLYSFNLETKQVTQLNSLPLSETSDAKVLCESEKQGKRVIIRQDAKDEKQIYLEQWDADGFVVSLKLPD